MLFLTPLLLLLQRAALALFERLVGGWSERRQNESAADVLLKLHELDLLDDNSISLTFSESIASPRFCAPSCDFDAPLYLHLIITGHQRARLVDTGTSEQPRQLRSCVFRNMAVWRHLLGSIFHVIPRRHMEIIVVIRNPLR